MDNKMESVNLRQLSKNMALAREASGKSIKEVCDLLSIPTSRLRNYEAGKYVPSLPELESFSYIYRIPLNALTGKWNIDDFIHAPNADQLKHLIEIRQGIISTTLLIAREKLEMTYKDLSKLTGVSISRIKRYEKGDSPPYDELIEICDALGVDFAELMDQDSPLGLWQQEQSLNNKINNIPEEMVEFFINADNLTRLKLAKAFSNIGIDNLTKLSKALSGIIEEISLEGDNSVNH